MVLQAEAPRRRVGAVRPPSRGDLRRRHLADRARGRSSSHPLLAAARGHCQLSSNVSVVNQPRNAGADVARSATTTRLVMKAKEPNPYLFKLDEKKRRVAPTLAHDFAKGSPCARCEHKCPGLELHFWKDICLNCGCHLNDHLEALKGLVDHDKESTKRSSSDEIGKIADRPDRLSSHSNTASMIAGQADGSAPGCTDSIEEIQAADPGRTLNLARKFQDWIVSGPGASIFQGSLHKLQGIYRRDDEADWHTRGKPVATAPVEKSKEKTSLMDVLPRPTPAAVVTVTDSSLRFGGDSPPSPGTPTEFISESLDSAADGTKSVSDLRCQECRRLFNTGQTAVVVNNLDSVSGAVIPGPGSKASYWHPHCFRCHRCRCLLKDNRCYAILGHVYCAEHFAEVNGLPKCTACDGWIFDDEFVWSKSHAYHRDHFLCFACSEPMKEEYILHGGRALCSRCFFADQGRICRACKSLIDPEEPLIENGLLAWHLNRSCFCCYVCHQLLDGSRFETLGSRVFCDRNCKDVFVTQLALRHKAREMSVQEGHKGMGTE